MDSEEEKAPVEFEEDSPEGGSDSHFVLDLNGYEGPIDVLLTLARDQKVDITKISILELAEQYIAFIERARQLKLEIAADYLVMAAWLAYLKSRLLLPSTGDADEPTGAELAARLAFQLQRLEAIQKLGQQLIERPQLGKSFFPRGAPERYTVTRTNVFELTLFDLLKAYADTKHREDFSVLHIAPTNLFSMEDALERLRGIVGTVPDWTILTEFLPKDITDPALVKSALAAHFAASLELTRQGKMSIQQASVFGPIFLKDKESQNGA